MSETLTNKEEKKNKKEKQEFASTKDLETLVSVVSGLAESIEKLNQKIDNKPQEQELKDKFEEKSGVHIKPEDSSGNYIPPKWREIVNKILGEDFGIKVVYPDSGSGFLFKIIVPESKSNMTETHRMRHKTDVRTKALGYSDAISGIQVFCEKIAVNLGMKKRKVINE
ncbi:hypothetical protein C4544_05160 [candidate division WS5 bacterium]|uniref:Uncharacterized protein n=1 Tax=candidate division WS5 bacterium TaxID=2093353 RepID=A0A419DBA9_9BACT|nr:MAG: hypothetical protein C4544_05160 [candidate division WS5 bacterium]